MKHKPRAAFAKTKHAAGTAGKRTARFINDRPVVFILSLLGILLVLIVIGSILRAPQNGEEIVEEVTPRTVSVFSIGAAPTVRTQAEIEKSGLVQVRAQSGGIIQQVNVQEGEELWKGQNVAWLSTNYQGGTVQTAQRQKAQENYEFTDETYDERKNDLDDRRKEIELNREQTEDLRQINDKTEENIQDSIQLNAEILNFLTEEIAYLEDQLDRADGYTLDEQTIVGLKQQKTQLHSSTNSLLDQYRQLEYNTDTENPPTELADLQERRALRNLEIEQKSLELNKELAKLDLRIAQINEALMYPATPIAGTVERVHVSVGDSVNPGDLIATITGTENSATAVSLVSGDIARQVSKIEPTTFSFQGKMLELYPTYISTEPVNGNLHAILYAIPEGLGSNFSDGSVIEIELPVGNAQTNSIVPFIPVESVYQSQNASFVYVAQQGFPPQREDEPAKEESPLESFVRWTEGFLPEEQVTWLASFLDVSLEEPAEEEPEKKLLAKPAEVELGNVYGSFVEVRSGLERSDQVILDRTVVENEIIAIDEVPMLDALPDTGAN